MDREYLAGAAAFLKREDARGLNGPLMSASQNDPKRTPFSAIHASSGFVWGIPV